MYLITINNGSKTLGKAIINHGKCSIHFFRKTKKLSFSNNNYYQHLGVVFLMDSLFPILVCEGFVSFMLDWAYYRKTGLQ